MAGPTVGIRFQGEDYVSPTVKSIKGSIAGLQKEAKKSILTGVGLGAGIGAFNLLGQAVAGAVSYLGDAAQAAREDETSVALLTQSLRENASAQGFNIAKIEETIEARMALGFADEEQRQSLRALVSVTKDANAALALQRTAMDLARLKGIDLETATTLLGKVYAGNLGILARYGIQLEKGATATEAIAEIQRRAAGQAQTWADTSEGAATSAAIAFDELKEEIGRELLPVMTELAKFARDQIVPALKAAIPVIKELVPLIAIGLGVKGLLGLKALATQAKLTGFALKTLLPVALIAGALQLKSYIDDDVRSLVMAEAKARLSAKGFDVLNAELEENGGDFGKAYKAAQNFEAGLKTVVGGLSTAAYAAKNFGGTINTVASLVKNEMGAAANHVTQNLALARESAIGFAQRLPGELANALRDGREGWKTALKQLGTDLEDEMTRAQRIAELKGALLGADLARGLASSDPLVLAQAQATKALGLMKRAIYASAANTFEQQLDLERDLQREAANSEDFREGVTAFREKRPAKFTGR